MINVITQWFELIHSVGHIPFVPVISVAEMPWEVDSEVVKISPLAAGVK